MMLKNPDVSVSIQEKLGNSYTTDPITNLPRVINTWTNNSFQVGENDNSISWIEKVNILEDVIFSNLDAKHYYYIIFHICKHI